MIFGTDRGELRRMYIDAWRKHRAGELLSPLESQIAQVVLDHPEYQALMTPDSVEESFTPERGRANPFLHMGLHLALRDQIATNRPAGVAAAFEALSARTGDRHAAEHRALDCLAETLWTAQRDKTLPDERAFLDCLRRLAS